MTMSLMLRVDEPRLEAIYSWLQQHQGSSLQLFGWESNQRAADDPSSLLPAFEQLELVVDEAAASVLNATFLGAFSVGAPGPGSLGR